VAPFVSVMCPSPALEADRLDWLLSRFVAVRCTPSTDPPGPSLPFDLKLPSDAIKIVFRKLLWQGGGTSLYCSAESIWNHTDDAQS
jgi:hypothetical protein